ncbi:MAG: glycosyltransferase [Gemmataceae bacterium]
MDDAFGRGIGRVTSLPRPRIAFVVNGDPDSAMAERAAAFARRLAGRLDIHTLYRRGGTAASAPRMLRQLVAVSPAACYVFDMAAAGVAAAGAYRHSTGTPFVVDTGDAIVELGRALGRGPAGMAATRGLEAYALRAAAAVVVRGSVHQDLLARRGIRSEFIPDGVTVDRFALPPVGREVGTPLTIGLVGSSVWVSARQTCYGWELVELIRLLKDRPIRGVMIGDGNGIDILRRRCREYGIADRVEFAGRVAYADLPPLLHRLDVCLSTQTNDAIGNVRTTGKLPLYLAAGRFVLASRVGEAARVLPPEMLVDFRGSADPAYPTRLADRVCDLLARGTEFSHRPECVALARRHFDYDLLASRVATVLSAVASGRWRRR